MFALAPLLFVSLVADPTPRERLAKVAKDYGIEIKTIETPTLLKRNGYTVSAKPVTDEMLKEYVPLFEKEWSRYPRSLMARTKLSRIVLGADVRVLDQPRAAVPEFVHCWLWLDTDIGSTNKPYGKHVLHHDFFHMIDEHDTENHCLDPEWTALNKPGVKYGKGGWFMQTANAGVLRTDLPGFLNEYSTSGVEEDKAEVYTYLLTNPAFMVDRVKADSILAAKVARLKALVVAFEPAMNSEWFTRNAVPVGKDTWTMHPSDGL